MTDIKKEPLVHVTRNVTRGRVTYTRHIDYDGQEAIPLSYIRLRTDPAWTNRMVHLFDNYPGRNVSIESSFSYIHIKKYFLYFTSFHFDTIVR